MPAEVFHPGEFYLEELVTRHADLIGVPPDHLMEIVLCKAPMTELVARRTAALWGGSAQVWLNLQAAYDAAQSCEAEEGGA